MLLCSTILNFFVSRKYVQVTDATYGTWIWFHEFFVNSISKKNAYLQMYKYVLEKYICTFGAKKIWERTFFRIWKMFSHNSIFFCNRLHNTFTIFFFSKKKSLSLHSTGSLNSNCKFWFWYYRVLDSDFNRVL